MKNIKIIAVDDEEMNLLLFQSLGLKMNLEIELFDSPKKALEYIISNPVDIIITDYMMPEINGIDFIKHAKMLDEKIFSVMVTAIGENEAIKLEALNIGVNDFLHKPLNTQEFKLRIKNLLALKESQLLLDKFNQKLKGEVEKATSTLIEREYETLRILSNTAEYKDPETGSHIARVAHYSRLLAKKYGLSEEDQNILFYASPLHDIGKVGIRDDVLLKPGKLDEEEFEYMKTHATIGYNILKGSKNPFLQAGAIIAKEHHEKYNGSGYPKGLKGNEIHIFGRITAIADVFDALTSVRPYKKAWSFEEAISLLQKESQAHFDPSLVSLFIESIDEVKSIYLEYTLSDDEIL